MTSRSSSIRSNQFIGLHRRTPPRICNGRSGAGRQGLRKQTGRQLGAAERRRLSETHSRPGPRLPAWRRGVANKVTRYVQGSAYSASRLALSY